MTTLRVVRAVEDASPYNGNGKLNQDLSFHFTLHSSLFTLPLRMQKAPPSKESGAVLPVHQWQLK